MKMRFPFMSLITVLLFTTVTSCLKAPDASNQTPNTDPGKEISSKIVSFSLLKKDNPSLSSDIEFNNIVGSKYCAYLDGVKDATSLIATFELSDGQLLVGDIEQESGKTANDFSKCVTYKYKQSDAKITECKMTLVPYTGLPLLFITVEGAKIPSNKTDWNKAKLKIVDIAGNYSHDEMDMEIRLRGNSTMSYPKKPFNIKLSEKTSMFGMPKHKRWSLLANYRDRSLLRNYIAFNIGQSLNGLEWTSRSHFVEVIFNGEYLGNYQFTEQIRVDGDRVDIDEMTSADIDGDNLTGGYLLEMDKRYDDVNKFRTEILDVPINIKSPDGDQFRSQHLEYIKNYINLVEKTMIDADFPKVYDELLDLNSFIDCWFVNEIVANTDVATPYSFYLYKKRNGKLFAGPIWDYDYAFNFKSGTKPCLEQNPWFKLFLKDPIFMETAKKRFTEVKPILQAIPNFIESQREYLRLSSIQNEKIWAPRQGYIGNKDEKMSYDESIDYLISFYKNQIDWLERYLNK